MTIKDKVTTAGGNRGYKMQRSQVLKGPDGYGRVVTAARERLLQKLGKDPGKDMVASHVNPGSHHGADQDSYWATRGRNTAESNMNRKDGISVEDKIRLKNYKSPKEEPKKLSEKFNARRGKSTR